jgi:hypothetical protein
MKRDCDACGKRYEAKSKRSRFCARVDCRRARDRERRRRERGAEVVPLGAAIVAGETGEVEGATLEQLTSAGRLETAAGRNALVLARRLDAGGLDTGSSVAALSKQHLSALSEALAGAIVVADAVDELRARRERRHA